VLGGKKKNAVNHLEQGEMRVGESSLIRTIGRRFRRVTLGKEMNASNRCEADRRKLNQKQCGVVHDQVTGCKTGQWGEDLELKDAGQMRTARWTSGKKVRHQEKRGVCPGTFGCPK